MSLELNTARATSSNSINSSHTTNLAVEVLKKKDYSKRRRGVRCGELTDESDDRKRTSTTASSNSNHPQHLESRNCRKSSKHIAALTPSACHQLVEQILYTVNELERTLAEDHQHDFELRMELERQTESVHYLRSTLDSEKQRNQRLLQLIRGVDSSSSTEEETENILPPYGRAGVVDTWQSRSSVGAFESISPLLMQQRYDELSVSYRQCRRQFVKKEKLLKLNKCEKEELQAKYDHLIDEYRNMQKRFEDLCLKYLRLQSKKNNEIRKLRDALSFASDCVISAQNIIEICHGDTSYQYDKEFRPNLQLFIKALRLCEFVQKSWRRSSRNLK